MMFNDDMFGDNMFGDDIFEKNTFEKNVDTDNLFGDVDIFDSPQVVSTENNKHKKKCSDTVLCGEEFEADELLEGQNTCLLCGSSLIDIEEPSDKEEKCSGVVLGDIITIDKFGYIHKIDKEEEHRYEGRDRLKICINGRVYKSQNIQFDEYTVGRNSTTFCPDIDLSKIDFENRISRKHLMIYREEDQFYVRNLSSKNTVYVNDTMLKENENMVINHKDKIILSNFIECEFEKASQEGDLIWDVE